MALVQVNGILVIYICVYIIKTDSAMLAVGSEDR